MSKNRILASCCSDSGKYLAICDDFKQLHLYKFDVDWKLISQRPVARRCTALTFTEDEKSVLVADKSGDVYRFAVDDVSHTGELLLGHLSMLLDIVVTENDKFVVTCDRDEKIRVSCYPNSYNVYSYCLKHTEYVASIIYIKDQDLLLSGSGDGKLIFWRLNGEALQEVDCRTSYLGFHSNKDNSLDNGKSNNCQPTPESSADSDKFSIKKCSFHSKSNLLCVCFYNSNQVHIYKVTITESIPSCELCDVISIDKEPWDICCDSCQNLYVLQPVEGETILVYELSSQNNTVKAVQRKSDDSDQWMLKLEALNKDWSFFRESEDIPSMYQGLKKVKVDQNMKDYLEKKQIRLSGQKIPQPPTKKSKNR